MTGCPSPRGRPEHKREEECNIFKQCAYILFIGFLLVQQIMEIIKF